jgi:hypothetical protein
MAFRNRKKTKKSVLEILDEGDDQLDLIGTNNSGELQPLADELEEEDESNSEDEHEEVGSPAEDHGTEGTNMLTPPPTGGKKRKRRNEGTVITMMHHMSLSLLVVPDEPVPVMKNITYVLSITSHSDMQKPLGKRAPKTLSLQ